MKRSQRIISLLLALVMLAGIAAGCGEKEISTVKMGQWLALISDAFGMESYTETKPFFPMVSETNDYFGVFQMAAEWDILAPSESIDSETTVTWGDAVVTLVNAGEFAESEVAFEDKYAKGISLFDPTIRDYWRDRSISTEEATKLLDVAQSLWSNRIYSEEERIEEVAYTDDVVDLSESSTYEEVRYVDMQDGTILMPTETAAALEVGDVYILPANESTNASINKVLSKEENGELTLITNDELTEEEAAEYIQDVRIRETTVADFTQIEGIYDQYGNPLTMLSEDSAVTEASEDENAFITNLVYTGDRGNDAQQVKTSGKVSFSVEVGDYTGKVTLTEDDVGIELSKTIGKKENRYREEKIEAFISAKIKDVALTKDIDYSWGTLHSATVRLDYDTTIEGGIKRERTNAVGNKDTNMKSISAIVNGYKSALETIGKNVRNSKCADDEIYICRIALLEGGVASCDLVVKGAVKSDGEIKIVVEVDGSNGIEYKNGKLRYIKTVDVSKDFVADGKLEVTISPGVAMSILKKVDLLGITIDGGIGLSWEVKAHLFDEERHLIYSTDATITADDIADLEEEPLVISAEELEAFAREQGGVWNNEMKLEQVSLERCYCCDWRVYPILRIGISESCLIGKLAAKWKLSVQFEVLGSKNEKLILKGHIDVPGPYLDVLEAVSTGGSIKTLFGIGAECSYKYTPWDAAVEEADELDEMQQEQDGITSTVGDQENGEGIAVTSDIMLADMRIFMEIGEDADIVITGLPEGYTLADLELKIGDTSIVEEHQEYKGRIVANASGTTEVEIKTKDGKYSTFCAVTVNPAEDSVGFSPLAGLGGGGGGGRAW